LLPGPATGAQPTAGPQDPLGPPHLPGTILGAWRGPWGITSVLLVGKPSQKGCQLLPDVPGEGPRLPAASSPIAGQGSAVGGLEK